jgi:hypothetical protein
MAKYRLKREAIFTLWKLYFLEHIWIRRVSSNQSGGGGEEESRRDNSESHLGGPFRNVLTKR